MKKKPIGVVLLMEVGIMLAVLIFMLVLMGRNVITDMVLYYFLDLPSFVCLVLFVLPVLIVSGTVKDFGNAFLAGKKPFTIAKLKRSLEAVKMVQQLLICGSFFIAVVTFIILLYNMDSLSGLGPCVAVMSLAFFYMVILEALLIPLRAHVQNQITDMMDVIDDEEN